MRDTNRPYVICHMLPSIDGRIVTSGWDLKNASREYERTAATFDADAWIIGRVSMEPYAGNARVPARKNGGHIDREDFIAEHHATSYAIAIDPSGKLRWRASDIDGEHVITVLTKSVSDDYLAFLQAKGVSYLFGGSGALLAAIARRLSMPYPALVAIAGAALALFPRVATLVLDASQGDLRKNFRRCYELRLHRAEREEDEIDRQTRRASQEHCRAEPLWRRLPLINAIRRYQ